MAASEETRWFPQQRGKQKALSQEGEWTTFIFSLLFKSSHHKLKTLLDFQYVGGWAGDVTVLKADLRENQDTVQEPCLDVCSRAAGELWQVTRVCGNELS